MIRVRLKFAFLPTKVGDKVVWLRSYWVEEIAAISEFCGAVHFGWVECSRAERFDEL